MLIKYYNMKKMFFCSFIALVLISCSNDEPIDITIYNSELSVVQNLENGVPVLNIVTEIGIDSLYGLEYGGGFI